MQKTKYEGIYKQQEGILLNMDNEALQLYKMRKLKDKKMLQMEKDVHDLKEGFGEIKNLLMILVNNNNNTKEKTKDS